MSEITKVGKSPKDIRYCGLCKTRFATEGNYCLRCDGIVLEAMEDQAREMEEAQTVRVDGLCLEEG